MANGLSANAEKDQEKNTSRLSIGFWVATTALVASIFGIVIGGIRSSSDVAKQLYYQPELGKPFWFWNDKPLYSPLSIFEWAYRFNHYGGAVRPIITSGMHEYVYTQLIIYLVFGILYGIKKTVFDRAILPPGFARWANRKEIRKSGLLNWREGRGIVLGRTLFGNKILRVSEKEDRHVFLMAPTRYGKGVGLIVPTLLEWPHSAIVLDIKGENWAMTSGWRSANGHRVLRMDWTTSPADKPWRAIWNPFDEISKGSLFRDSQRIAMDILDPDGKGFNDHWVRSGYTFLSGIIMYLYMMNKKGGNDTFAYPLSMRGMSMLMSDPSRPIKDLYKEMLNCGRREIEEIAREMLNWSDPEESGIISTINGFLSTYRDEMVTENTSSSNFSLLDFIDLNQKPITLYITVPPSDIERLRSLIRLFFNTFNDKLTKDDVEVMGKKKRRPVLFLLDELPALGKLQVLENGIAHNAQYGIRYFLVAQSLGQMRNLYGENGTGNLLANCYTQIFMGTPDPETSEMISKMLGKTIRYSTRYNYSGNRFSFFLAHAMSSMQESERNLLSAHQISQMKDDLLIFRGQMPPILAKTLLYYKTKKYMDRILPSLSAKSVAEDFSVSSSGKTDPSGKDGGPSPVPVKQEAIPSYLISPSPASKKVKVGMASSGSKRSKKSDSSKDPEEMPFEHDYCPTISAQDVSFVETKELDISDINEEFLLSQETEVVKKEEMVEASTDHSSGKDPKQNSPEHEPDPIPVSSGGIYDIFE